MYIIWVVSSPIFCPRSSFFCYIFFIFILKDFRCFHKKIICKTQCFSQNGYFWSSKKWIFLINPKKVIKHIVFLLRNLIFYNNCVWRASDFVYTGYKNIDITFFLNKGHTSIYTHIFRIFRFIKYNDNVNIFHTFIFLILFYQFSENKYTVKTSMKSIFKKYHKSFTNS